MSYKTQNPTNICKTKAVASVCPLTERVSEEVTKSMWLDENMTNEVYYQSLQSNVHGE